jgi:butyryl-CoA dehydrogenase
VPLPLTLRAAVDFELTEEQQLLVKGTRDLAQGVIAPRSAQMDRDGSVDPVVLEALRANGYFSLGIPRQYGGLGLSTFGYGLVIAELARVDAGIAIMVSVHNGVGTYPIMGFGNEQLRLRVLPAMASGTLASFCVTEPGVGSDAANLTTRAEVVGSSYRLTGEKIWVTNGAHAGFFVVLARMDGKRGHDGISAFLVERGAPGLTIGAKEDKMGLRCSDAVSLVLDDVAVPRENLIGEEGQGFKIAMASLDGGRIGVAYQAVGLATACLEAATRYAQERDAFGGPISNLQAIQWMIAQAATELEAATLLAHKAATLKDQGKPFSKHAAMAKLFGSEMAGRTADMAVQVHGGFGYSKDYDVERYFRDARVLRIYEGTSEVQKLVIARRHFNGER